MKNIFHLIFFPIFLFCSLSVSAQLADTSLFQLKTIQKLRLHSAKIFLTITDTLKDSIITPEYLSATVKYSMAKDEMTIFWRELKEEWGTKSTRKYGFDKYFRCTYEQDDEGTKDFATGMYQYDQAGRMIKEWWNFSADNTPDIDSTYYNYDGDGKLIAERYVQNWGPLRTDSFYYDSGGRLILMQTFYSYVDSISEITMDKERLRKYKYDGQGRLIREDVFYYSGAQNIDHYFYDYYNNGLLHNEQVYYGCADSTTRYYSAMRKWTYNEKGMITRFTTLGFQWKFPIWDAVSEYDERNLLVGVVQITRGQKMIYRYVYE